MTRREHGASPKWISGIFMIVSKTADSSDDNPKYAVSHLETAVSLPANHMKRGKFYTYTFTISLKEIKVSAAKVNDWGSVTGNFDVN